MPVVAGEHSLLCEGKATSSHPHLLGKLVVEMGCDPTTILPIAPTIQFSKSLTSSLESIPRALGCLGIGNEAMLIPEYSAIESLFSDIYEKSVYQPFLRANIEEDRGHSALMEIAAVASFGSGEGRIEFLTGAKAGVDARVSYYSELTKIVGAMGSELQ